MDALSRRPNHNDGMGDNNQTVALLDKVFIKAVSTVELDHKIRIR
jgi:hypothetical protein